MSKENLGGNKPHIRFMTMNEYLMKIKKYPYRWEEQTEWEIYEDGTMLRHGKWPEYEIAAEDLVHDDWVLHILDKGWDMNAFIPAYFEACRRAGLAKFPMRVCYDSDIKLSKDLK